MSSPRIVSTDRQRIRTRRRETRSAVSSAHLIGICGAGMKAVAELLTGLGWQVTGSDLAQPTAAIRAMQRRGLRIHRGHDGRSLPDDADVVVYSPAIGPDNPERLRAEQRGIPLLSYSQMLGRLMRNGVGVSIAGTHGKSTTTALVASVLTDAGLSPSAVVGAELCCRNRTRPTCGRSPGRAGGWAGDGELFVAESCEYRRSFLDLAPRYACILGIEPDHFDYFTGLDDAVEAFSQFAALLPADGLLLINADCPRAVMAAKRSPARVVTFSSKPGADWWAADLRTSTAGTRFRIFRRDRFFAETALALPGRHNVVNALAAAALCHHLGVSPDSIREGLWSFPGLRRRFETVGSWRGMTLIDDYAHHPTAVAATLRGARERFGRRRIWCAFQPHQVSRTRELMQGFAGSFREADEVLIAPAFAARENVTDEHWTTAAELASRIAAAGQKSRYCPALDRIISTLDHEALPGDVLITMGAGDVDRVHHEFTGRLQRHHPPR